MGETRGKNERVSNARPTVMSFRKLYREQFIGGGGALPLPLAGYGISQFDSGEFHFPVACQESKSEILAILAGSLL
jgi:hypothetical protein